MQIWGAELAIDSPVDVHEYSFRSYSSAGPVEPGPMVIVSVVPTLPSGPKVSAACVPRPLLWPTPPVAGVRRW